MTKTEHTLSSTNAVLRGENRDLRNFISDLKEQIVKLGKEPVKQSDKILPKDRKRETPKPKPQSAPEEPAAPSEGEKKDDKKPGIIGTLLGKKTEDKKEEKK